MSIQEVSPERLAELFHRYHQALGPDFGSDVNPVQPSWKEFPPSARRRMVAAARLVLLEFAAIEGEREGPKPHFAKPGEAEWGC